MFQIHAQNLDNLNRIHNYSLVSRASEHIEIIVVLWRFDFELLYLRAQMELEVKSQHYIDAELPKLSS